MSHDGPGQLYKAWLATIPIPHHLPMTKYRVTVNISIWPSSATYEKQTDPQLFTLTEKPRWRSQFECFHELGQYVLGIKPHSTYVVRSAQNQEAGKESPDEDSWMVLLQELQATNSGILLFRIHKKRELPSRLGRGKVSSARSGQKSICDKLDIQIMGLNHLQDSIDLLANEIRQSNQMTQQLLRALGESRDGVLI